MTAEEEFSLARIIRSGKEAAATLAASKRIGVKRRALLEAEIRSGKLAQERFVRANTRLAIYTARKYSNRGMEPNDLVQEGVLGIIHALGKYDPDLGYRFSTYAIPWIKQYMGRAVANQARLIRIPEHRLTEISKVAAARQMLADKLGEDPTDAQIAEALGMNEEKINELSLYALDPISLHLPAGEDGESELGDLIADEEASNPVSEALSMDLASQIRIALSHLSEKETQVLSIRYGMGSGSVATLEQTSQKLGISRERARQLESRAIAKLRHPGHSHLRDYLMH